MTNPLTKPAVDRNLILSKKHQSKEVDMKINTIVKHKENFKPLYSKHKKI
ncbi:MAG: hypothetical protein KGZ94_04930 [Clostridia bacterium]|nr:hypothetical protein [Clostridia bacterium]